MDRLSPSTSFLATNVNVPHTFLFNHLFSVQEANLGVQTPAAPKRKRVCVLSIVAYRRIVIKQKKQRLDVGVGCVKDCWRNGGAVEV